MNEREYLIECINKNNKGLDDLLDYVYKDLEKRIVPYDIARIEIDSVRTYHRLFYIPKYVKLLPLEHMKDFLGIKDVKR